VLSVLDQATEVPVSLLGEQRQGGCEQFARGIGTVPIVSAHSVAAAL